MFFGLSAGISVASLCQSLYRSHTYFDTEQQGHEGDHDEEEQEEHEEPSTPMQPATEPHHAHVLL